MVRRLRCKLSGQEWALVTECAGIGHPSGPARCNRQGIHMHKLCSRRHDGLGIAAAQARLPQLPYPALTQSASTCSYLIGLQAAPFATSTAVLL